MYRAVTPSVALTAFTASAIARQSLIIDQPSSLVLCVLYLDQNRKYTINAYIGERTEYRRSLRNLQ